MGEAEKLLRRPKPRNDESPLGFLLRVAERNGYSTAAWVVQLSGFSTNGMLWVRTHAFVERLLTSPRFSYLIGLDGPSLTHLPYVRTTSPASGSMRLVFNSSVPESLIRLRCPKVCPKCLKQSLYCRKLWDLALVTACPLHRTLLLDECRACGAPLSWLRESIVLCPCGNDLRDAEAAPVEDYELELTGRIYRACGQALPRHTAFGARHNPLNDLDLPSLATAVVFVASQLEGFSSMTGKRLFNDAKFGKNEELHRLFVKAHAVFSAWPDSYFNFLDWRRTQDGGAYYSRPNFGVYKEFDTFYATLQKMLTAPELSFMRDAFDEYLLKRWDGGQVPPRCRPPDAHSPGRKYLTKTEVTKRLGTRGEAIDELIQTGQLKAVVKETPGNKFYLIEAAGVEELRRQFEQSLTCGEAAALLGIDPGTLVNLIESGCLRTLPETAHAKSRRAISVSAISALLGAIESAIVESTESRGKKLLGFHDALRQLSIAGYSMGAFVKDILDGRILPCGKAQGNGLAGFAFSKGEIDKLRAAFLKRKRGKVLSAHQAVKLLRMHHSSARFLISKGIITAEKRRTGAWGMWAVTEEAICAFKETYMTAVDAAREAGMGVPTLLKCLESKGIKPYSGPSVDGGRQYIIRRDDVKVLHPTIRRRALGPASKVKEARARTSGMRDTSRKRDAA